MNPPHGGESRQPILRCRICHNLVPIEAAKPDSDGRAVHENCFSDEINQKLSSTGRVDGHLKDEKRPWSVIATELCQEQNATKVIELAEQLIKVLDEIAANPDKKPDGQSEGAK